MNAYCTYTEHRIGKKKPRWRIGQPCFIDCTFKDMTKLDYYAAIEGGLNPDQVRWWVKFLRGWLHDLDWDTELVSVTGREKPTHLKYTLKSFSESRKHNLLYCTAFRYIDEYSPVVRALFGLAEKGMPVASLFKELQVMHWDMIEGVGAYSLLRGHDMKSHSLIHPSGGSTFPPITMETFNKHLTSNVPGVQLHFCENPVAERERMEKRRAEFLAMQEAMGIMD
jgi:hypothetical protein